MPDQGLGAAVVALADRYVTDGAAAFLGPVGATEIADLPDVVEALRNEGRASAWSTEQVDRYIAALDKGSSPTAYLFRCRVCSVHLAYSDFT